MPATRSLSDLDLAPHAPRRGRGRAVALSLLGHAGVVALLFTVHAHAPKTPPVPPVIAELYDGPPLLAPTPDPAPAKAETPPAKAASPAPNPPKSFVRPTTSHPVAPSLAADKEPGEAPVPGLSDAELAGAATAESGGGGGACNMTRLVQAALRRDSLVQSAVAGSPAAGKAVLVWNGDWVRSGGQDGRGLAAVREAVIWEVGFAPAACRTQAVRGLVVVSLGDGPGATRLAIGGGEWRWSDLLHPRRDAS